MKTVSSNKVRRVLRRCFNLKPRPQGNGSGHEVWIDARGRSCKPLLRKKDVSLADLFSLGREMETKGICDHRIFMRAVLG